MTTPAPKPATILHRCRVPPPPDAAAQSLPLLAFDLFWIYFHPIQRLLFYQLPCSKTHFLETIVPSFTKSLSQTLKHYVPLAGNLTFPPNGGPPELQFQPGDSVLVTVAESHKDSDFEYLTGNQSRDADEFHSFVPDLPESESESDSGSTKVPLFAVQITLFPNTGISIGFTNHHAVGDASSIVGFIKNWSLISKFGENNDELAPMTLTLPLHDRSVIKDLSGLANLYWEQMRRFKFVSLPLNFPTNKVRATFILHKHQIQDLKNLVQSKRPNLTYISSFTITTAYVWTCLAKATAEAGEDVEDTEPEYFGFAVDARARLDPSVPPAYFGNCLAFAIVESTHGELKGENGFVTSVALIGEFIKNKVNNKEEIFREADKWVELFARLISKRICGVAGSPKFDLYDTDFGWGKVQKYEAVGIDGDESMSLCKSREFEGGLEIGLSLRKKKMDAFAHIFENGLKIQK